MKKRLKIIMLFVFALIVFIVQQSFINYLPWAFSKINLAVFLVAWLFIFQNLKTSLYFSLFAGIIFDIFSFYPFGIFSLTFMLTVMLADIAWENLFTNRSIYSFVAIGFMLTAFYNLFLYFLLFFFENNLFGVLWFNALFWKNLLLEISWVLAGLILSFYIISQKKGRTAWLSFDKK